MASLDSLEGNSSISGLVTISKHPDIRIFYAVTSDPKANPTKPIIVLSNSLAASTALWDDFVTAFSRTHIIIRYDARFHGQSPRSADSGFNYEAGHSLSDLAADVITLLDEIGIPKDRAIDAFVGLSIGGSIGVILAAEHSDRFKTFIIVGTKAVAGATDGALYDARITFARQHGAEAQARQSVERWFDGRWIKANPERAAVVERIVGGQDLDGLIASIAALRKLDLWPYANVIKEKGLGSKVLFVVGELDAPPVVEDTKKLADEVGSEVEVIQGAGHIVNIQVPEKFHAIVRDRLLAHKQKESQL